MMKSANFKSHPSHLCEWWNVRNRLVPAVLSGIRISLTRASGFITHGAPCGGDEVGLEDFEGVHLLAYAEAAVPFSKGWKGLLACTPRGCLCRRCSPHEVPQVTPSSPPVHYRITSQHLSVFLLLGDDKTHRLRRGLRTRLQHWHNRILRPRRHLRTRRHPPTEIRLESLLIDIAIMRWLACNFEHGRIRIEEDLLGGGEEPLRALLPCISSGAFGLRGVLVCGMKGDYW